MPVPPRGPPPCAQAARTRDHGARYFIGQSIDAESPWLAIQRPWRDGEFTSANEAHAPPRGGRGHRALDCLPNHTADRGRGTRLWAHRPSGGDPSLSDGPPGPCAAIRSTIGLSAHPTSSSEAMPLRSMVWARWATASDPRKYPASRMPQISCHDPKKGATDSPRSTARRNRAASDAVCFKHLWSHPSPSGPHAWCAPSGPRTMRSQNSANPSSYRSHQGPLS